MLCMRRFNLVRSFSPLIREERETLSLKGTSTKYRPGRLTSAVNLGPFVLMGSLATCTSTRIAQLLARLQVCFIGARLRQSTLNPIHLQ